MCLYSARDFLRHISVWQPGFPSSVLFAVLVVIVKLLWNVMRAEI